MMETAINNLLLWLKESNQFKLNDKIHVVDTVDSGRGVFLLDGGNSLKRNEIVVSIPSNYQLNFYTVLHHISKFNSKIALENITLDTPDDTSNGPKTEIDPQDPRLKAYKIFQLDKLTELKSFQLLSLYILAEWILLPVWSSDCDEKTVSFWEPFFNVWPTRKELNTIPAIWLTEQSNEKNANSEILKQLFDLLPNQSKLNSDRIRKLVQNDWNVIKPYLDQWDIIFDTKLDLDKLFNHFVHIYFIINSRCLYCEIPLKQGKDDFEESNFTLVPFVDFLNHSDQMDQFCFPEVITSQKIGSGIGQFIMRVGSHEYNKTNEQIFLNYGPHSNDFLLCEYGFVMNENKWNFIDITNEIISLIDMKGDDKDEGITMIDFLKGNDYFGDYTINMDEISYRTLVALSLVVTKDYRRIEKFMQGYITEEFFMPKIKSTLLNILHDLSTSYTTNIIKLNELSKNIESFDFKGTGHRWYIDNMLCIYQDYLRIIENQVTALNH